MSHYTHNIQLGGHRGLGCTDNGFYHDIRHIDAQFPVENTLHSIEAAFRQGAAYVEVDAVMLADGTIVGIHNTVLSDHFFNQNMPPKKLNEMTYDEVQAFKTGPYQTGTVALMADIMALAHETSPQTLPYSINIELKHLSGSKQAYADNGFLEAMANVARQSSLPENRILYSGFPWHLVMGMTHLAPQAQYGLLTREYKDGDDTNPPVIGVYTNHTDSALHVYQPFNAQSVELATQLWSQQTHPQTKLSYMHPEIGTVTDPLIADMAKREMGLNLWELFAPPPGADRVALYRHVAAECRRQDVPLTFITDYLPEMQALFPRQRL